MRMRMGIFRRCVGQCVRHAWRIFVFLPSRIRRRLSGFCSFCIVNVKLINNFLGFTVSKVASVSDEELAHVWPASVPLLLRYCTNLVQKLFIRCEAPVTVKFIPKLSVDGSFLCVEHEAGFGHAPVGDVPGVGMSQNLTLPGHAARDSAPGRESRAGRSSFRGSTGNSILLRFAPQIP